MSELVSWKNPPKPRRSTVQGRYVRLEPLEVETHAGRLWTELAGADVWTFMSYGPFSTEAHLRAALAIFAAQEDPLFFAIVEEASDRVMGWLALLAIRPEHGVLEIGNVLFSPAMQRTAPATEAVFLAANLAFTLGYRRVEWKCDTRNEPSRRAALRYGFVYEGAFRQHMIVKGRNRDTAWFALLDRDWPARRTSIEAWLDPGNFDAAGKQRTSLARALLAD